MGLGDERGGLIKLDLLSAGLRRFKLHETQNLTQPQRIMNSQLHTEAKHRPYTLDKLSGIADPSRPQLLLLGSLNARYQRRKSHFVKLIKAALTGEKTEPT